VAGVLDQTDIGISTGAYRKYSLGAALMRIAEIAPHAEVVSLGHHTLLNPANARAVEASGLPFSVHGPFTHAEFASSSPARHREALDLHRRHMAVAAELGAHLYIVHPDLHVRRRRWNRKVVDNLHHTFEELRALQDEMGLDIAVENMPLLRRSHFTAPGDLDLRGLGLVLDIGHANLAGSLTRFVAEHNGELRHLHLHDNGGRETGDMHLPLGAGVIDFAPALREARAACATIVLEHVNEKDVQASFRHLKELGLLTPPPPGPSAPASPDASAEGSPGTSSGTSPDTPAQVHPGAAPEARP
jgi:sugar phosphate isomerase/epimerase